MNWQSKPEKGYCNFNFNKTAFEKTDINPNGSQIIKTCLEYMGLNIYKFLISQNRVLIGTCMTTSCHFKICLKSHTTRTTARPLLGQRLGETLVWRFGHSFIRHLRIRWNEGSIYNSLTFSREAQGFDGLSVTSLLQFL